MGGRGRVVRDVGGREEGRPQLVPFGHRAVAERALAHGDAPEGEHGLALALPGVPARGDAHLGRMPAAPHGERGDAPQRSPVGRAEALEAHLVDLVGRPLALHLDHAAARVAEAHLHPRQRRSHADLPALHGLERLGGEHAERRPDVDDAPGRRPEVAAPVDARALAAADALDLRRRLHGEAHDRGRGATPAGPAGRDGDADARAGLERAPRAEVDAEEAALLLAAGDGRDGHGARGAPELVGHDLPGELGGAHRVVEVERERGALVDALGARAREVRGAVEDDDVLALVEDGGAVEGAEVLGDGEGGLEAAVPGAALGDEGEARARGPDVVAADGRREDERVLPGGRAADVLALHHRAVEAHLERLAALEPGGAPARGEQREDVGLVGGEERREGRRRRELFAAGGEDGHGVEEHGRHVGEGRLGFGVVLAAQVEDQGEQGGAREEGPEPPGLLLRRRRQRGLPVGAVAVGPLLRVALRHALSSGGLYEQDPCPSSLGGGGAGSEA